MPFPSPIQFGQMMELSENGLAVLGWQRSSEDVGLQVEATIELLSTSHKNEVESRAYLEEFNSRFLLSLVRSLLAAKPSDVLEVWMNAVLWAISGAQVAAHRFVRLYPDLALKLYEQVGWGFAAMAQQIDGPITRFSGDEHEGEELRHTVSSFYAALADLSNKLYASLPTGSSIPPLPPVVRQQILRISVLYQRDAHLMLSFKGSFDRLQLCQDGLRAVAAQVVPLKISDSRFFEHGTARATWWACHYTVDRVDGEMVTMCTKLAPGKELLKCSRCKAVRYCSKDHQTADWKRHKRFCFQPTW